MKQEVRSIIEKYDKDETRLMDILMDTQEARGYISPFRRSGSRQDLPYTGYSLGTRQHGICPESHLRPDDGIKRQTAGLSY